MDKAASGDHTGITLHAKMTLAALLYRVHLRVPLFSAFFVELDVLISVVSTIELPRIIRPACSRQRLMA